MALACRIPLRRLETMAAAETPDTECLAVYQAMLTGAAGLLPSQRDLPRQDDGNDRWIDRLEKRWAAAGEAVAMSERDWQFFRVRPANFPTRRIAAMSQLLLRFRREGLLNGLIGALENATADRSHQGLEEALIIEAGDGRSAARKGEFALLGRERAANIIINVLLPFAAARGGVNSCPDLAKKAVKVYFQYPALATNTLERHMSRQFGIEGKLVNTARRQQGLLHIFKTLCSVGGCPGCPINPAA